MARFYSTHSGFSIDDAWSRHTDKRSAMADARRLQSQHGGTFDVFREEKESGRGWVYFVVRTKTGNPRRVKLPAKWTSAKVRVNRKGEVQIAVNPGTLGTGRFAKCVKSVSSKGGAYDPRAVCAAMERRKYGKKKFAAMGRAGKKRAARRRRR